MKKETLTLSNIQQDLSQVAYEKISNAQDWRFSYIIPVTLIAFFLGIYLKNGWIAFILLPIPVYHIVRYSVASKEYRAQKKAMKELLSRGDISISVEQLSHIAIETIYEPHTRHRHTHHHKEVSFYYFQSANSWRVPNVGKHYPWSKEYAVSTQGLANISVEGNEFFYISLQGHHDIAYIYPCKFFVLDESLKKQ